MISTVSVLLLDGVAPFEFGTLCEVFGVDRSADGLPVFDFRVCGERPGESVMSSVGVPFGVTHGLDSLVGADLVAVPASAQHGNFPAAAIQALRDASDAGAVVMSVCSGAFLLGEAGLLDGRACTTHWLHAAALAARFPQARVNPDVLFVDEGNLITSAGTAAGIDACLHLVRRELGSAAATAIARRMVVPIQRDGGQRQYVSQPIPECSADSLSPVLNQVLESLDADHTIASMSRLAVLSERTFARRFVAETGTTPHRWLTSQRVLHARHLLEESDLSVDSIAMRCGFGTAAVLRHHFRLVVGITPAAYRQNFSCPSIGSGIPHSA
jgi:AraC family transcriptional regulator, transcriptional activator FtrA